MIQQRRGVKTVSVHDRYLGLPTIVGRSKKEIFSFVQDRVWKKVKGWKEKVLSRAGKEVLLKSVAQAIPSYIMSCFKLPDSVCSNLESMMANFWWGQKSSARKIHWMAWKYLCRTKNRGGLGFRHLGNFNKALLAKQVWRLATNENTLLYKVLKSRYFPRHSLLNATLGHQPSFSWRSLFGAMEIILDGTKWVIGNGSKIKIWRDNWLPGLHAGRVLSELKVLPDDATVDCLLLSDHKIWNTELINYVFHPIEAAKIINIPISWSNVEDKLFWRHTKDGNYTVRSAYHILCELPSDPQTSSCTYSQNWSLLWKLRIPGKIKHFLYRLLHRAIPCRANLKRRGVDTTEICPACDSGAIETVDHIFLHCHKARATWLLSSLNLTFLDPSITVQSWWDRMVSTLDKEDLELIAGLLWSIWKARNKLIFQSMDSDIHTILSVADSVLRDWNSQQQRQPPRTANQRAQVAWQPPNPHHFKMNIDVGWSGGTGTGLALIVRNFEGIVQVAATSYINSRMDPLMAEATAIRALNWDIQDIIVETDCQTLQLALIGSRPCLAISNIVADCHLLMSQFSSTHREGNVVAHLLASHASVYLHNTWWTEVPSCIALVVASKLSSS